jgi:tetratricopeptide (TPR) repeat protein
MKVFLSHASEQDEDARSIEIALRGEGHSVFLAQSVLPSGASYNDQIRDAITRSDLFLFLISPEAVDKGRYTLTELEFAEMKWPSPSGFVLPVMIKKTEISSIPPFLKAVTILEPQGNVPAAVAAAVAWLSKPWWRRLLRQSAAILILVALIGTGVALWWGYQNWVTAKEVSALLEEGELQRQSGNYSAAWDVYARASALAPRNSDVAHAQERVAIDWLDNIRVISGKETFTSIVEKVQSVLSRCAISNEARRAGDCLAHMGWGDFLRWREGLGGLDPVQHYQHALKVDPENVYAHAMWGFHVLAARPVSSKSTLTEAKAHFTKALASGREVEYVRRLQINALAWFHNSERDDELVRLANEIRTSKETMTYPDSESLWSVYWDIYFWRLIYRRDIEQLLSALPPADHLATFIWLFPENKIPEHKRDLYLIMLATFQELAGDHSRALATYREVHIQGPGSAQDVVRRAIDRLSKKR